MRSHAGLRDAQGRTFSEFLTEQISEAIFRSGLSMRQAAAAAGINRMTLSRSLSGKRAFDANDVALIAEALSVSPAALMKADEFTPSA